MNTRTSYKNMVHYLLHAFGSKSKVSVYLEQLSLVLYCMSKEEYIKNLYQQRGDIDDERSSFSESSSDFASLSQKSKDLLEEIRNLKNLERHVTGFSLAEGGCKRVFTLNHEMVIALLNVDCLNADDDSVYLDDHWRRIVHEEVEMAVYLKKLGLQTQDYSHATINYEEHELPVLLMPSFQWLEQHGMQVRDMKNAHAYGASMLFGCCKNINTENLRKILQEPCKEIICLLENNIKISSDTMNLVIKDTALTPDNSKGISAHYAELNQTVHLYFYDFSHKEKSLTKHIEWPLNDNDKYKNLKTYVSSYLDFAITAVCSALTAVEIETLKKQLSCSTTEIFVQIKHVFNEIKNDLVDQLVAAVWKKMYAEKKRHQHGLFQHVNIKATSETSAGEISLNYTNSANR